MLGLTILGNNSALSTKDRHHTAQILTTNDQLFLIDCGESTQIQMQRYQIKKSKINHIFISHLHGDHYFGLPGLLNSYSLTNRKEPLHLYAPPKLKDIIDLILSVSDSTLGYELIFHALNESENILDLPGMTVSCFPVSHRIPCWGFLFKEKIKSRKVDAEKALQHLISKEVMKNLKNGEDVLNEKGELILNEKVTTEGSTSLSYAYCADTMYDESIIQHIRGAHLIYHETTYLDIEREKATQRYHSTGIQAATIAKKADAKKLLIGHFSSKYEKLEAFENEARSIFENSAISVEGTTYLIRPDIISN
jgi:ribonuclease Z